MLVAPPVVPTCPDGRAGHLVAFCQYVQGRSLEVKTRFDEAQTFDFYAMIRHDIVQAFRAKHPAVAMVLGLYPQTPFERSRQPEGIVERDLAEFFGAKPARHDEIEVAVDANTEHREPGAVHDQKIGRRQPILEKCVYEFDALNQCISYSSSTREYDFTWERSSAV